MREETKRTAKKRGLWRRIGRALLVVVAVGIVALAAGALVARSALLRSLARETGTLRLAGLTAPVTVERDALGVPVIRGKTFEDVCRAQGFVHAQERFFQMDLARRGAAGEIAEILGSGGVEIDREARPLRFRTHAREVVERLPEAHQRLLTAYTAGVNAGLADLRSRPPEYWALRVKPAAWREEDCVLVGFLMYRFLNYTSVNEKRLGTMRDTLPAPLVEFLTPEVTRWDAPLTVRDPAAEAKAREPMPIPGPEVVDLRGEGIKAPRHRGIEGEPAEAARAADGLLTFADLRDALAGDGLAIGSNNWAVAASRSKTGRAMIANDMHLGISAPNTWYRVQLEWEGEGTEASGHQGIEPEGTARESGRRRVVGVSLPGTPSILAGSNGRVAWGFTNVEADVQDLVIVEVDPTDAGRYRVAPEPDGAEAWERFGEVAETIAVKGGAPIDMKLRTTRWGVVTDTDYKGRPLVLKWTALEPDKVNLAVFDMVHARTVDEGAAVARRMFIPPQNVVMADDTGRIGWAVCGWLPRRVGFDGKFPHSWAQRDGAGREFGWDGQINDFARPSVIDPGDGVAFTANNRTAGWPECREVGNSWTEPVRARRIGEMLREADTFDERDLLRMQLDVKAESLEPWRAALERLGQYASSHSNAGLGVTAGFARAWNGEAGADQAGFRIVRAFRMEVSKKVFEALTAPCKKADETFRYDWFLRDETLLRLIEEAPEHLAPPTPAFKDSELRGWEGALANAALSARATLEGPDHKGLDRAWGEANRLRARHPISRAIPFLGRWLDLPSDPLPGSGMTVRAQGTTFGASERFVVSPGHEESAIFHMPGGQSGHFLSRHYTDGHAAWVRGDPTPLLAGAPVRTLTLTP